MNRYKIIIFVIFLSLLCIAAKVDVFITDAPLFHKVIYIDAGHGGADPGAIYKDIYEKDINLEITKLLQESLMSKGAIVYMTREGDYDLSTPRAYLRKRSDLSKRVYLINKSDCDLYLSIHLNSTTSSTWKGAQVFYDDVNPSNEELAKIMQKSFKKYLGSRRQIEEISTFYMYRKITRPGVLLEVGFLSNANDRYILRKPYYQKKIVTSIVEGIMTYLKQREL